MRSLVRLLFVSLATAAPTLYAADPTPLRQHELIRLVRQDCGSCHGMTLKGGLGSPLLPDNLRDKPASSLVATVVHGRPGTAMPPWKTILAEGEAEWIVAQLLTGFPSE
jgi:cytochrome c55X